ncbi:unnamed protein product [Spirodela intermedia]|uniref:Uncharacterized protein n=1 Tax=Spirodela intermedia TaxID=51605 RepID=A0ABN7EAT4_SPIIN|nr:unnamed protein product [Spirodela intermedia]
MGSRPSRTLRSSEGKSGRFIYPGEERRGKFIRGDSSREVLDDE